MGTVGQIGHANQPQSPPCLATVPTGLSRALQGGAWLLLLLTGCTSPAPEVPRASAGAPTQACPNEPSSEHPAKTPTSPLAKERAPRENDTPSFVRSKSRFASSLCVPTCLANSLPRSGPQELLGEDLSLWGEHIATDLKDGETLLYKPGVGVADLAAVARAYNRLRAKLGLRSVSDTYGERRMGEGTRSHVRRLHDLIAGSLKAGYPVTLSLSSYAYGNDGSFAGPPDWYSVTGHAVLVKKVGALQGSAISFSLSVVEPYSGSEMSAYVIGESHQDFSGWHGSFDKGHWRTDFPFLRIEIPRLPLGRRTLLSSQRSTVLLSHMIYLARDPKRP